MSRIPKHLYVLQDQEVKRSRDFESRCCFTKLHEASLEGRPAAAIAAAAVILAALYGLSDEIHQAFVPGRMADPWDWMADGFGAAIGAAAWAVMLN